MRATDAMRAMLVAGCAALAAAMPLGAARAGPLDFDFSYTGTGISASGVLITDGVLSGGAYTVTGITGARNSVTISGLSSFLGADNLLFPSAPYVDSQGITYTAGGVYYNFYESGDGGVLEISSTSPNAAISLTVTPATTAVPEPWSAALLGAGLIGFAVLRRAPMSGRGGIPSA